MRRRLPACAVAAALALPLAAREEAASPAPAPPTFAERITIRETEILVERPPERRMPRASDLKVLVDGRRRTVARIEEAGDDAPWHLVLYIDRGLASPGTLFSSLLALAVQAETLTRLGSVEILEAGSARPVVEPTRDARAIRWALGDLAGAARLDRDRAEAEQRTGSDKAGSKPIPLSIATAGRKLDRLVARLAERRPSGPRALFLIADGSAPELAPPFERAARLLAGYAWVTFPILVRKEIERTEIFAGQSELEIFRRSSDVGAKNNMSIPPMFGTKPGAPTALAIEGVVELLFDPEVAGFRALAKETAGAVIGREAQLAPALDRLGRRMRVWIDEADPRGHEGKDGREAYDAIDATEEQEKAGRLQRLEVMKVKSDQPLRASAYLRSSTPEELTAARLRLLLEGEALSGDFELDASWAPGAGGGTSETLRIHFEPPAKSESEDDEAGPVRVTWGWIGPGGEIETGGRLFTRFSQTLPIEVPAGVESFAVVADDLALERWGRAVLRRPVR